MSTTTDDLLRTTAWQALATVVDPELDEPITDLGFVANLCIESAQVVRVRLRLPTYFCAPNFAYLMAADAYDAISKLPGVEFAEVRLDDHFASEEINAGIAAMRGFSDTFYGLADDELDQLRQTFRQKAHLAAQDRLGRRLCGEGWEIEEFATLRIGDVEHSDDRERLLRRRHDLGLPTGPDEPLLVAADGQALTADQLPAHLRFAQAVRVSTDGNASFCRGLLRTRYGSEDELRVDVRGGKRQ